MPKLKSKVPQVVVKQYTSADTFGGMNVARPHLVAAASVNTVDSIISNSDASKEITVYEVTICTTPQNTGTLPFVGTLATEDSADDLLVFCPNRLWTYKWSSPFKVGAGKDLVHHHVQANTATVETLNSIQILYSIDDI